MDSLQNILNEMGANGLTPPSLDLDKKIHKFKVDSKDYKKSGWYIGYQNYAPSSGELFYVVVYGNYKNGGKYKYQTNSKTLSSEDYKKIKTQQDDARRKHESEIKKYHEECATLAQETLDELRESLELPDYLKKKGFTDFFGCFSKEIPFEGVSCFMPLRDIDGKLWSFQVIKPDGFKKNKGRKQGCFHTIGVIKDDQPIRIVEGLSTGITVHLATNDAVVVAVDAGNLSPVATEIKKKYLKSQIIICGDDDCTKDPNVGRKKAEEAARKCLGEAVFPVFKNRETSPTDWDDLRVLEGIDVVRDQLLKVKAPVHYVAALGFREKEHFFTSSYNRQVVSIQSFTKADFVNLMPINYWEALYPTTKGGVNWDLAMSDLMTQAKSRGIFQSKNIRGAGVWSDEGRIVINMGDHLIVDGKEVELGNLKSRYFYTLGIRLPKLHPNSLTVDECEVILKASHLFKWKRPEFGYLLAGAMVTTRVCGALSIRPHVWLTGEKGSGKTTLFNRFIYPLIGEPLLFLAGNSTEAGIRQEVSANAIPVLFDEFENNGQKSAETIQSVLDLMRVAWSETSAVILKGSANGVSQSYQARFSAIVTSIRQVSLTDADQSRFATIELNPHDNDLEHWSLLESYLNNIDMEYGNRLFARTIKMLPILFQNFKVMKRALNNKNPGQRFGDQYGMLLAGYSILLQDDPITDEDASIIADFVQLDEAVEASKLSDQQACLNQLLSKKVQFSVQEKRLEGSFSDLILRSITDYDCRDGLASYGIRVEEETFSIRVQHTELENLVFKGTRWSNSWGKSLIRLHGAVNTNVRIAGIQGRCIVLPINILTL